MEFGLAEFKQRLPDADTIRALAAETMRIGQRAHELMDSAGRTWLKLTTPEIYTVPGNEKVFTALDASRTQIEALSNSAVQIDALMRAYADSVDWLRMKMEEIDDRIAEFNRDYPESEQNEWDNDGAVVHIRNNMANDVGRLHSDLDEAQRDAAARITHITGSDRAYAEYNSYDPEFQAYLRPDEIIYGNSYDDYSRVFSGGDVARDLPWWQDTLDFAADTGRGIPAAAWEFVTDLGVLIGFQGWDNAGAAWTGMGRMGANLVIAGSPDFFNAEQTRRALDELSGLGQELIRMDQWQSDRPGLALGGNIFDIGSLFIGGAGVASGTSKAAFKAGAKGLRQGQSFPWKAPLTGPEGFTGLVPALPGGNQLPVAPRPLELPDNSIMYRGGKGTDFAPSYSPMGRDPAFQPAPGGNDGGAGRYQDIKRNLHGAPEQQYITGIDRQGEYAREYVVTKFDGTEVSIDGHQWRGDPPVEVFTEVKGHLDFLESIGPGVQEREFSRWVERELAGQAEALAHSARPGYIHEVVFTEKAVMDAFEQFMLRHQALRSKLVLRYEPMP